jgi:ATP-dependent Lon protease
MTVNNKKADERAENKSKNKKKKQRQKDDKQIQLIFSEVLNSIVNDSDISKQIKTQMNSLNWKMNLDDKEIQHYQSIYDKICDEISTTPKIIDILRLSIPYNEKCEIIEQILILHNAQPNTFEFLQLKRHLNKMIKKYKHFILSDEEHARYEKIEESLVCDSSVNKPLKYQILDADMSLPNKSYLYQRYKYYLSIDSSNFEHGKLRYWIDTVLKLPTKIKQMSISASDEYTAINRYLYEVKKALDQDIFGLNNVKEKILFLLNNRISNNRSTGLSFALCGPPGTAKTSIIRCLSRVIELPYFQINLGGARDSSFLCGHSFTYEGSMPGVIVQALNFMKFKNGIIYFDEIDKVSTNVHGSEISRMLLHITDFSQNDKYHDRYLSEGIDIDLSNIWFIYSLNNKDLLDTTLADRIPIIMIDGYDRKEKMEIVEKFLIPKSIKNIGLGADDVTFSQEAITYLIEMADKDTPPENFNGDRSGVRQVEHLIDNILMKINLLKTTACASDDQAPTESQKIELSFAVPNFKLPVVVTKRVIESLKIPQDSKENISYKHMYI